MEVEEKYMERCLALARHGIGKVSPNPLVGAVLLRRGKIIGEGYHRCYGEAHAEVHAIRSVADETLLRDATLYVNLEPCSHYGKTPPCTELIIRKGIPRVVVACLDPYHEVSGRGIDRLRQAGVEVMTGVKEREALALNKEFVTSHTLQRPYIYLKWAQSADGFIDRLRSDVSIPPVLLSSPAMLQQVHKRRSEVAAILVGTRTALLDNPSLTVRNWSGHSPVRVVLDRQLSIPDTYHLLDGQAPTLVFTALEKDGRPNLAYVRIDFERDVLPQLIAHLHARRLTSLLVEGGAFLLNRFIAEDLWDEMQVETAPVCLGGGVKAPAIPGINVKQSTRSVYSRKNQSPQRGIVTKII
jgi:diaminohydroxyphosphoribosylaminopyrimidine deaminase/5-amino-6-(5-phosphoribosylamino)uracil reductase